MIEDLQSVFYAARNSERAEKMSAYLKNQFVMLGIESPKRKLLEKPFIAASKKMPVAEVLTLVKTLYQLPEREFTYAAIDIAFANTKRLTYDDLSQLYVLVETNAWWESVDGFRSVFETWCLDNYDAFDQVMTDFSSSSNIWSRRVAITMQLKYRDKVDTQWLDKVIAADRLTDEFFIQKAIGWALREYSKTNSEWVEQYVRTHELSNLATREALKIIRKGD